jgi:TorA maturation chaperone TorD
LIKRKEAYDAKRKEHEAGKLKTKPRKPVLEHLWTPEGRVRTLEEYEKAFIGVGKQEIFLYGSYYLTGFLNEKPLAALRADLEKIGLQSSESITETEDHIACLCEVMRYLIAGEDLGVCNLTQQKLFFDQHIRSWSGELFEILQNHPELRFYKYVGALAGTFFEIEGQAFDML